MTGHDKQDRLAGLRRFAVAITVLNVLGHLWFGFEQSWATPFAAVATAYATEILLEGVDSRLNNRRPRFKGTVRTFIDFLLSAHISGLAVGMLLYANDSLLAVAYGAIVAIASKAVFRMRTGRHFFNPSNFGITVVLVSCPWVGIVPPYHFTENLGAVGSCVLPAAIICSGTFLNARFTKRIPLILAWVTGFALQAIGRWYVQETPFLAGFMPMTGVAFLLYTFYMITDPATTPDGTVGQVVFGGSVAAVYGLLVLMNVVFGMFFALTIVCAARAAALSCSSWLGARQRLGVMDGGDVIGGRNAQKDGAFA